MTSDDSPAEPLSLLCYGDSNTYGAPAEPADFHRWSSTLRWTGRLQQALGPGYKVVEEGLRGRTTDVDYVELARAGRNGLPYFGPCVYSHDPLHAVIIMLGTNDLKFEFDRSPKQIAASLNSYIDTVRANTAQADGHETRIILVSPPRIDDTKPLFETLRGARYDRTSVTKSHQLASEIRRIADQRGAEFVDAAEAATVGADGVHFAAESHKLFAERLAEIVLGVGSNLAV
ncbi:MAG: hypothetical protein HOQ05_01875 [Corynebacteriales bacterium]|nr:hypothetical protein [Mycobacteriales bacterium]